MIASGNHVAAERLLEGALADAQLRPEACYLLAVSALMSERFDTGLERAREAVAARPKDPRFHFTLGRALMKSTGDVLAAETAYRCALRLRPVYPEAMVSLGIALRHKGEIEAAIGLYEKALLIQPKMVAALANLSNALALRAEKKAEETFDETPDQESLDAVGRAVALDLKNPVLHRNYGVLLAHAKRRREAVEAFNEALTLDPTDVEACLRLGDALVALGGLTMAIQAYEKWLDKNPPSAPVMRALAGALTRSGAIDKALEWSEKVLVIDRDGNALMTFAGALMQARRQVEAISNHREAILLSGGIAATYSGLVMGLNYVSEAPDIIFAAHEEFGGRLPPVVNRPHRRVRPPGDRLRVGYVSGDFVHHSVSHFIGGLLEHRDRERFEVFCYHNNPISDFMTARLKSHDQNWFECHGLSDEGLRHRIIEDQIDVLIDLAGHTAHSRYAMFALGAAPVQLSYLGYPTVSGVPAIDFRITDETIDPGDMPPFPSEAPLCLPRTMFCFRPDSNAPALVPPPAQGAEHVTFGSFNNIAKVTDHTLCMWADAMNTVPGSRLLLKSGAMAQASNRANIEAFMLERGIDSQRLMLQPWKADKRNHLEIYNEIDIALDPFPYNGATTTCEALWMGVPVVTRRGMTHTSRMGASLLGAIDQKDWVAESDADFTRIVTKLATDIDSLATWRKSARDRMAASPLLDERGFTRDFEALLLRAWQLKSGTP